MIREDYIMRMVKQFTKAVTKILRLKESHQYDEALKTVNETFQELFGLKAELFSSLSRDSIVELLKLGNSELMQKCFWVAELMREEAAIYESQGKTQKSKSAYLKSLELYLEGITYGDNPIIADYLGRIKEIMDRFELQELTYITKCQLLKYYEKTGDYSKVEDLLFKLLEYNEDNGDLIEYGISFYGNLMTKSDKELIDGNFPREKVIKGKLRLGERNNIS